MQENADVAQETQKEAIEELKNVIEKNHGIVMKSLSKIREYNEISDMTNQVFEIRMSRMEQAIFRIENKMN